MVLWYEEIRKKVVSDKVRVGETVRANSTTARGNNQLMCLLLVQQDSVESVQKPAT